MKKIISMILVFAIAISTLHVAFATEVSQGNITSHITFPERDIRDIIDLQLEPANDFAEIETLEATWTETIPGELYAESSLKESEQSSIGRSATDVTFNANLLTSFNTITGPTVSNGANEPKFSYNRFLEETVSDYSGELTLNFEDLVLDGRNGLDLRIGRTYQSVAAGLGEPRLVFLPNENGQIKYTFLNDASTYLLDRYNLGLGWGFNFPSVQIETEYIPAEIADSYYYDEETELYYHSGNGEVYQVQFTADTTDSNLKGYYNKDIQFNSNDTAYANGQVTSQYSMTLANKTKQYFAADGRLIGIVDRFGNTIKFEHELASIVNRVPQGDFVTSPNVGNTGIALDNDMWTSSEASDGTDDALHVNNTTLGSHDGYMMKFRRHNENDNTYLLSCPIQVKPLINYTLGMRFKSPYDNPINIEIIGYDTAYSIEDIRILEIENFDTATWVETEQTFSMSSAIRYIQIKICPDFAEDLYIDYVHLDEPKPLIKKITDSIGRTVDFSYQGDAYGDGLGTVTLTVTSPDGSNTKELVYYKNVITYGTAYMNHYNLKKYWNLYSSNTEGTDGSPVQYIYEGGATADSSGGLIYPKLYVRYDTKTHSDTDGWVNKLVLSGVRYKDRLKTYEYETVRKHLGDSGYYDTLRVKKKYDMYACATDSLQIYFKGELGTVNYSYGGSYNGNSFDNETGYPNYTFDDETALNELWTVTKIGKTTDTVTFSNGAVVQQTRNADGTNVISEYTNHDIFKHSPVQIKNTVAQNGVSKNTYLLYSYNDWGGIATESKEVDDSIKNDAALLEKCTTAYQYHPDYHEVTQKSYYNSVDSPQVSERNTFDASGRLIATENAVGEKTQYHYENASFPSVVTKVSTDDPMRFLGMMGSDKITTYTYDIYGLYPIYINQSYEGTTAQTEYFYDYITGNIKMEILPDGAQNLYTYYSDGKLNLVYSPYGMYTDDKIFYTIEEHSYTPYALCSDYNEENPVYEVEQIWRYAILDGEVPEKPYASELNFYDAVGNLKKKEQHDPEKTDADGYAPRYVTKYYHDVYDRLMQTIDSENHAVNYSYDGFDRPVSVTDSENHIYTYVYNSVQNQVDLYLNGATEAADRHLLTQQLDLWGNTVKNTVYPDNTASQTLSEEYTYDLNGNCISYTDANGNKIEYAYDNLNQLKETILPNGVKVKAEYSAFGEPAAEKIYAADGTEKLARFSYRNEKGDLTMRFLNYDRRAVDRDGYAYDGKGRTIESREGEHNKSALYDQLDNLVALLSEDSAILRNYDWFGEIVSASNDGKTQEIRYGHDGRGNISVKQQNGVHLMGYIYSSTGNVTHSLMPSNRQESYTYTANGNLDTVVTEGKTFDYDYYDTGYVKSITYPNGLKTAYNYDNINRVTSMTTTKGTTTINTLLYEYDSNGNVVSETRNGADTTYTYDSLDRLLSVTYNDGSSVAYEYDALNNRTKEIYSNGDVKDYVYDAKYQLKEIKLNGQVTDTFTYNETGAVVTHNNKTYTYDEWDRLSGYTDGTDTYTYKYDANGIRTQKNDKQYIIDINNNVVAETDSAGAITDEVLWGHQPLARKVNGSWYYYIYNAHGDVVGLVNDAGTVVNTYEYTPWGEIRNETETVDNPIKYAGEYYDDELDMIYLRARYYNPQIGRFTSLDIEEGEIARPLDMNRYVYCRNNPIKYVDPTGMLAYPGQIHNLVVNRVANEYGFYTEETINYNFGWGRADLISASGSVWDVKRDKPNQIAKGVAQVQKYVNNTWKRFPDQDLSVGGDIASGSFTQTINIDTYYITYRYAGNGIIAYDYYKITDWDAVKAYASAAGMTVISALAFLLTQGAVQLQPAW